MPNARVPAAGGAMSAELPTLNDIAATILRKSAYRMDRMRREIERDLDRNIRSRQKIEALIERLIDSLDEIDGGDDAESECCTMGGIDPDLEAEICDEPHDDEAGMHGVDAEPSLGAAEGCRHDQRAWSSGSPDDCESDEGETGIGPDGEGEILEQLVDQRMLAAHARFDGSGERIAREALARLGKPVVIAPRARRPTAVRVGGHWFPR